MEMKYRLLFLLFSCVIGAVYFGIGLPILLLVMDFLQALIFATLFAGLMTFMFISIVAFFKSVRNS
ncbi:hypothetical protein LNP18_06300 [Leuconostoc citreum]|uniref:hypothetical protein n=1 Tax=Leuconostoc citreum TaxID=33964 RepID=UPI00200A5EF3|nr:hypothetical protein [Leuconostoc citreum]MCK8605714.1 hypothetical protein [Leuconostoc citreum]